MCIYMLLSVYEKNNFAIAHIIIVELSQQKSEMGPITLKDQGHQNIQQFYTITN